MSKVNRQVLSRELSLHFGHRYLGGVKYEVVLESLENEIDLEDIKSIQITEKDCVITVSEQSAKDKLLRVGLNIKDKFVKFFSVEKEITNVTIKDAPYEMSDSVICSFMTKYGEVVPGSIRHGQVTFKNITIDNGTRYVQLLNCAPSLPNNATFGSFPVRIFADNGRTPCVYCGFSTHPSYKCDRKHMRQKACYICQEETHLKKDCPQNTKYSERLCYECNEPGHIRRNCPNTQENELVMYGEYASEIREGREADEAERNEVLLDNAKPLEKCVILGASNCKRCIIEDDSVVNASVSRTTIADVTENIALAHSKISDISNVEKVVVCLGTNDVTRNKSKPDKINVNITKTAEIIKKTFENAEIALCTIISRRGKSVHVQELNTTTSTVNEFIKTVCEEDEELKLIDLNAVFTKEGIANQTLYDQHDSSGVHVNELGAKLMLENFNKFFSKMDQNERKRSRAISSTTSTPSPNVRKEKKCRV
ncbi:hypothetical protein FSP39_014202 [Pinctada imbricata]|uniref:CCHC-type domain-containing protein n=1 Tax=Pinctada imbricata TaxID=66713 RepID=A0AA89C6J0_PINIB|nr:hypothetical protein FSP39_014202 [Pinctada imbricata]